MLQSHVGPKFGLLPASICTCSSLSGTKVRCKQYFFIAGLAAIMACDTCTSSKEPEKELQELIMPPSTPNFETWLADALRVQRLEVAMQLEEIHQRLAVQILMRSRQETARAVGTALEGNTRTLAPDVVISPLLQPVAGDHSSPASPRPGETTQGGSVTATGQATAQPSGSSPENATSPQAPMTDVEKGKVAGDENVDDEVEKSKADETAAGNGKEGEEDEEEQRRKNRAGSLLSQHSSMSFYSGGTSDVKYDYSKATIFDLIRDRKFADSRIGHTFEFFWSMVILCNATVMAVKAQYNGLRHGYRLSYQTYYRDEEDAWPGADTALDALEKMFTILFTIELVMRFYIFRCRFLREAWCYFDSLIVLFAWMIFFQDDIFGMNVTFVRLLRITKMIRMVRLLRHSDIFDSLKLLAAAIGASVNVLFWSILVLLLVQCLAGLFMVQILEDFLEDKHADIEVQRKVFGYFGTFWRALITMFEITFANWAPSCRLLVDFVAEGYGIFYLAYRCVIGFAVLMVVQAVFIQQTMKTTQLDDEHIAAQKSRSKAKTLRRLESVFRRLDNDGSGLLDINEIHNAVSDRHTQALFSVFDLEADDFQTLFKLLDDGDGQISVDEFVKGIEHMKGAAREIDLMSALRSLNKIEVKLDKLVPEAVAIQRGNSPPWSRKPSKQ